MCTINFEFKRDKIPQNNIFSDDSNGLKFEAGFDKPNKLLLDSVHEHLQLLHDSELSIGSEDSLQFLRLLYDKHNSSQLKHQCPLFQCFESCKYSK